MVWNILRAAIGQLDNARLPEWGGGLDVQPKLHEDFARQCDPGDVSAQGKNLHIDVHRLALPCGNIQNPVGFDLIEEGRIGAAPGGDVVRLTEFLDGVLGQRQLNHFVAHAKGEILDALQVRVSFQHVGGENRP